MKAAPSQECRSLAARHVWSWAMGLVLCCLLLMPASVAFGEGEAGHADADAHLAQTQATAVEAQDELHEAQQQLKQLEEQRAQVLDEIRRSKQELEQAELEAKAVRAQLKDANAVLMGIEQGRIAATHRMLDAAISTTAQPEEYDGNGYPVTGLVIEYQTDHPDLPPAEELMEAPVLLLRTLSGFVAPRPGELNSGIRMIDIAELTQQRFYGSAIDKLCVALVSYFHEQGLIGVYAGVDPTQISRDGKDLRPAGQTTLRIIVQISVIGRRVRTIADSPDIPAGARINNPKDARIRRHFPLKPTVPGQPGSGSLLLREPLEEYINRLNRHPGRRVDVSISADDSTPGKAALDLIIHELKLWTAYVQVSNTGTESTNKWRERFGFVHNNLTSRDDIFSVDYSTAGFDEVHTVVASYEAPLMDSQKVRWRVQGLYSEYTASDFGLVPEEFSGDQWSIGAELIANIHQNGRFFVDLVAGITWKEIRTENVLLTGSKPITITEADADFFLPHVGLTVETSTDTSRTDAQVRLKVNVSGIGGSKDSAAFVPGTLGRINTEEDYAVLEWSASHSFFLEPIFDPEGWRDPSPGAASTLAHEMFLSVRGQTSMGDRLIPQEQMTLGGLYTVRGYEPSEVVGDSAVIATIEYRYHLPRGLALRQEPGTLLGQPFKWAPQQVFGLPDWDLILRAFVDGGYAVPHDKLSYENSETMLSTGVGVELLLKRNVSVRADWGIALDETPGSERGDNELHFVATLLY